MNPEIKMKCSLTIKKIPHWVNTEETIKVRQVDEEEAHGASKLGLTVFRDAVYEEGQSSKMKRKKGVKPYLHKFNQKSYSDSNSDSDYVGEFSDTDDDAHLGTMINSDDDKTDPDFNINDHYNFKSTQKISKKIADDNNSDPDFNYRDHYSDNESNDNFNFKETQKTSRKIAVSKSNFNKAIVSHSCKPTNKNNSSCNSNLDTTNNKKKQRKYNAVKRKDGINYYYLIPVVKKYETPDEMERRHEIILERAKETYENIVNDIEREKKLMNLELMTLKVNNKTLSPNPKQSDSSDNENGDTQKFCYLCPFQYCSMPLRNPKKHLQAYHKMVTEVKDVKLYINAVKNLKYFKRHKN